MSAPRIKVEYVWDDDAYTEVIPEWRCLACTHGLHDYPAGTWGVASTLSAAADAGRAHLAAHHTAQMPQMTPVVQTIVSGARCTCGDLPRQSFPYFAPCPVHVQLMNTTTAQMPPVAHGDPELAHVAPGPHTARPGHDWSFPCCTTPMQHAHTHSREDT